MLKDMPEIFISNVTQMTPLLGKISCPPWGLCWPWSNHPAVLCVPNFKYLLSSLSSFEDFDRLPKIIGVHDLARPQSALGKILHNSTQACQGRSMLNTNKVSVLQLLRNRHYNVLKAHYYKRKCPLRVGGVTWVVCSPRLGSQNNQKFGNLDPDFPIHYTTFRGYD